MKGRKGAQDVVDAENDKLLEEEPKKLIVIFKEIIKNQNIIGLKIFKKLTI